MFIIYEQVKIITKINKHFFKNNLLYFFTLLFYTWIISTSSIAGNLLKNEKSNTIDNQDLDKKEGGKKNKNKNENLQDNIAFFNEMKMGGIIVPTGSSLFNSGNLLLLDGENKKEIPKKKKEKKTSRLAKKTALLKKEEKISEPPEKVVLNKKSEKTSQSPSKLTITEKVNNIEKIETINTVVTENKKEEAKIEEIPDNVYRSMPVSFITTESKPQISFSGDICSFMGTTMQDDSQRDNDGDLHISFGWAELYAEAKHTISGDMYCKFFASLKLTSETAGVLDNYLELQSPWGILQVGNLKGPERTFFEDGISMIGGTGGTDGSMFDMLVIPDGIPNLKYIANSSKRATKLNYYTNRIWGVQAGLGFSPDPNHFGWGSVGERNYDSGAGETIFMPDEMKRRLNIAAGINFEQEIAQLTVKTAVVAVREKATMTIPVPQNFSPEQAGNQYILYQIKREVQLQKDTAYQASASVKYGNFQIAAGFINNGNVGLPSGEEEANLLNKFGLHLGDSGKIWNVGGKYSIGCVDIGLAYNKAKRRVTGYDLAQGNVTMLTVDCQIVSGLKVFAEFDHINTETDPRAAAIYGSTISSKNRGKAIMIGSKISF
jgi:hypothetical protein